MSKASRSITYALLCMAIIFIIMAWQGEAFARTFYVYAAGYNDVGAQGYVYQWELGSGWTDITPTVGGVPVFTSINDLALTSDGETLYAVGYGGSNDGRVYQREGGVWTNISPSGGDHYANVADAIVGNDGNLYISGLAFYHLPGEAEVHYYDGTWHSLNFPDTTVIDPIANNAAATRLDFDSNNELYMGGYVVQSFPNPFDQYGIVYKYDSGTWVSMDLPSDYDTVYDVEFDVNDNFYVTGYGGAPQEGLVYWYDPLTDSWVDRSPTGTAWIGDLDTLGTTLYAGARSGSDGTVFISDDGGQSWTPTYPPGSSYITEVVAFEHNNMSVLFVGGTGASSSDGEVYELIGSGSWMNLGIPTGSETVNGLITWGHFPELPPGALQLLMTLLAGGLAWAKKKLKI